MKKIFGIWDHKDFGSEKFGCSKISCLDLLMLDLSWLDLILFGLSSLDMSYVDLLWLDLPCSDLMCPVLTFPDFTYLNWTCPDLPCHGLAFLCLPQLRLYEVELSCGWVGDLKKIGGRYYSFCCCERRKTQCWVRSASRRGVWQYTSQLVFLPEYRAQTFGQSIWNTLFICSCW